VPFQEAPSPPMTPELYDANRRAAHVVTRDGAVLRAGRACLFVLDQLGYRWVARIFGIPPLSWAVELGYRIVASNRTFFSRLLFRRTDQR